MNEEASEGDPWATISARSAIFARLHTDGALSEVPCMACGYPTLSERGGDHICVVCHWRDDGSTREQSDRRSAANHGLTLRQAAAHIAETGVFASQWHALAAPEYFAPAVRAARADLVAAYERLKPDPLDASARAEVQDRRVRFMYAIVNEMR
jgi:Cysteine-rich CPCC